MKRFSYTLLISAFAAVLASCGGDSASTTPASGTSATPAAPADNHAAAPAADALVDLMTDQSQASLRSDLMAAIQKDFESKGISNVKYNTTHFKMKDTHAFFVADVTNADGTPYKPTDAHADCCHVEALVQMAASNIMVLKSAAFSTDAWYVCLWKEMSAPKEIFPATQDACN